MFGRKAAFDADLNNRVESMLAEAGKEELLPIVQMGEPVLRQQAQPYQGQLAAKTLSRLLKAMRATMLEAPGVGLAAPQVGLGLAIAVIEDHVRDDEDDPRQIDELPFRVIINPSYEPIGQETAAFYEGCLSLEGFQAVRRRWLDITASWEDRSGRKHRQRMHGWPARIFQHETDHLSGEVYIDKAEIRSLSSDDNLSEYWAYDPVPTEAARELGFTI
ncbi:peptide deformylase [Bifidobacterium sp. W8109]|uniref:peptide deformylase n=1 Tax=Bifidobacterium TaxID=1678 RepID=UPI0018DC803C|nr:MULTISPECIES: peptide deformylase [Bifidobacterium]MBH9971599.1 peptide deformylase [Bifidobacterium asteroides]MBH9980268.1 peptide deformylase [Bifidobacterium asteroides]MBI0073231.1 peptide deformylase [Bifidobacterium sp. W8110]MBI0099909.1 peptide deformylase [Bifidobacterium sp. W8114]